MDHKTALRDVQKSPRRIPKPSPEGPWTPPGRPKREPERLKRPQGEIRGTLLGPQSLPGDAPDGSRGHLGVSFGPPGLRFGVHFVPKTCLGTQKRGVRESEKMRERERGEKKRREEKIRGEEKRREEKREKREERE